MTFLSNALVLEIKDLDIFNLPASFMIIFHVQATKIVEKQKELEHKLSSQSKQKINHPFVF
jgi:hypothetical protein